MEMVDNLGISDISGWHAYIMKNGNNNGHSKPRFFLTLLSLLVIGKSKKLNTVLIFYLSCRVDVLFSDI